MSFFIAFHPSYIHELPVGHRFPMEKYQLIYDQLDYEGLLEAATLITPDPIQLELVEMVHDSKYVDDLIHLRLSEREQRVSGFKHIPSLIERELRIMEGTRRCAEAVIAGGIALNIAGGTHHAFTNKGEGFCLLNDQAIAAKWLLENELAKRILIIDLDVHQGNGTAEIFSKDSRVFTFSMHGTDNYPLKKEHSDLDIALSSKINDAEYLNLLQVNLTEVFKIFNPDFVFYQCGVDVLETDKLGLLSLTQDGVKKRDAFVLETVLAHELPLVCSMGGGYSVHIRDIVNAHMHVFRLGYQLFEKK